MAPAAGGAGSSSGAPRETLLHSPGEGVAAGPRPTGSAGSAGLEVRSVYPPFTAGVHKQVCALPSCSTDVDPTLSHPLCRSCQGIEVGAVPALRAPAA